MVSHKPGDLYKSHMHKMHHPKKHHKKSPITGLKEGSPADTKLDKKIAKRLPETMSASAPLHHKHAKHMHKVMDAIHPKHHAKAMHHMHKIVEHLKKGEAHHAHKHMAHLHKMLGKHHKNWIAGAIKHPGALRSSLGAKAGKNIPKPKLAKAAKKGGVIGKRARLAETLKGFHHKK